MRKILSGLLLTGLLTASALSFADQLWRCSGNTYTNTPTEAQKQAGCKLIEDGGVSVIPNRAAEEADVAGEPVGAAAARRRAQQEAEQAERNAMLERQKVQAQLDQAKKELAALELEYNNGQPARVGIEFKNYQWYLNKVERLKEELAAKRVEVDGLQEKLGNVRGPAIKQ